MINRDSYNDDAINSLYSAVETAIENNDILDLKSIAYLIHEGDFYLRSIGKTLRFCFNGLRWVKDGKICTVVIQPQGDTYDAVGVKWVVVDCVDEKDFLHSCDKTAINKEYRYTKNSYKLFTPGRK
ncbi:MAG: hypothetical protein IJ703_10590 [Eubacterium sp.]|nr:hypothetical protein [Eubacterium sp.]